MKFTWSLIALIEMPSATKSSSTAAGHVVYCMY